MDKLDAAIGIYKYGIKNVSVADENFKVSTSNVERQKASTIFLKAEIHLATSRDSRQADAATVAAESY